MFVSGLIHGDTFFILITFDTPELLLEVAIFLKRCNLAIAVWELKKRYTLLRYWLTCWKKNFNVSQFQHALRFNSVLGLALPTSHLQELCIIRYVYGAL